MHLRKLGYAALFQTAIQTRRVMRSGRRIQAQLMFRCKRSIRGDVAPALSIAITSPAGCDVKPTRIALIIAKWRASTAHSPFVVALMIPHCLYSKPSEKKWGIIQRVQTGAE
eukprot:36013-Pleurochrysis_carterae.AAC.1